MIASKPNRADLKTTKMTENTVMKAVAKLLSCEVTM
jgi:hypothetical protein